MIPFGGSYVNLTPLYNIVTGNTLLGAVVSHILKSLLHPSGILSNKISSYGMNDAAKWQFYKNIHLPWSMPSFIAAFALSP